MWQQAGFGAALRASAIITLPTVAITVVASVPAGYAFATMKFRGRSLLFYTLLLGLLIPLEAMIIPLYFDLRPFGLTGNYWGVILPETALSIAFGSFWMRAFFLSAPRSLIEAARIDGANTSRHYAPCSSHWPAPRSSPSQYSCSCGPGTTSCSPWSCSPDPASRPRPSAWSFSKASTPPTTPSRAAIITAIPAVLIYVLLQRSFVRGMLSGAIKG